MTNLRQLRKQRGLAIKDIARVINVTESAISQYENGKREPDYETLKLLADYFYTSTDYLLDRVEEPQYRTSKNTNCIVTIDCYGKHYVHNLETKQFNCVCELLNCCIGAKNNLALIEHT